MNFTEVIETIDFYIDINYCNQANYIVEIVSGKGKSIYVFNTTVNHREKQILSVIEITYKK